MISEYRIRMMNNIVHLMPFSERALDLRSVV